MKFGFRQILGILVNQMRKRYDIMRINLHLFAFICIYLTKRALFERKVVRYLGFLGFLKIAHAQMIDSLKADQSGIGFVV